MINIRIFRSVRARLLAIMALVTLPIAVVSLVLASATYQSVVKSISTSQKHASVDYEIRTRVWFVGNLRTLSSVAMLLGQGRGHGLDCNHSARDFLAGNPSYNALYIRYADGSECSAHNELALKDNYLSDLAEEQSRKRFVKKLPVLNDYGETRLDAVVTGDRFNMLVFQRYQPVGQQGWTGFVLVAPNLLEGAYRNGKFDMGDIALINDRGSIVTTGGIAGNTAGWLPKEMQPLDEARQWRGLSRDGRMLSYSNHPIILPNLAILARYDDNARQAASIQFLVLCITPLLTLALLFLTYARAIQDEVVRWIYEIRAAALARTTFMETNVLAPVNPEMPIELRSVSVAFNQMVKEAAGREHAYLKALEKNDHLIRELHHRVKNSLQVIQSYLALTRRQKQTGDQAQIMETEARVQVLSTAYRIALSDGVTQSVPLRVFVEEIVRTLLPLFQIKKSVISCDIDTDGLLQVDRVIPLGLAIVEAAISSFTENSGLVLRVFCKRINDDLTELAICTSGDSFEELPPKIMWGLAEQMAATDVKTGPKDILRWRFAADAQP